MGVEKGPPINLGFGNLLKDPHDPLYQLDEDELQVVEGLIQQGLSNQATSEERLEYIEDLRFALAYDLLAPQEERNYRNIAINRAALEKMGM